MVLERLRLANGRLECQEKAIDVSLVPWRAGSWVPKGLLEGFGRFGAFEGWQTAGSNAMKTLLMSP